MRRSIWVCAGVLAALPLAAGVTVSPEPRRVVVTIDGQPFTNFILGGEGVVKPYFHPIYSASGKIVTRQFPMARVEGESRDHPHHRGLWFTHGDVNGVDFWAADPSRKGGKQGSVVLTGVLAATSGDKEGTIRARFDWKGPEADVLLREDRTVVIPQPPPGLRIMDLDIRLTAVREARFVDTKEGTFAIRVADSMNEKNGGVLRNAEGVEGEKQVWGRPSPYMNYFGTIGGEQLGIAILDHPSNPGHPTHWHVRSYGLFAANIFGLHDFYNDKARDGGRTLEPGQTWRFRYRVIVYPGSPEKAGIREFYEAYAKTE